MKISKNRPFPWRDLHPKPLNCGASTPLRLSPPRRLLQNGNPGEKLVKQSNFVIEDFGPSQEPQQLKTPLRSELPAPPFLNLGKITKTEKTSLIKSAFLESKVGKRFQKLPTRSSTSAKRSFGDERPRNVTKLVFVESTAEVQISPLESPVTLSTKPRPPRIVKENLLIDVDFSFSEEKSGDSEMKFATDSQINIEIASTLPPNQSDGTIFPKRMKLNFEDAEEEIVDGGFDGGNFGQCFEDFPEPNLFDGDEDEDVDMLLEGRQNPETDFHIGRDSCTKPSSLFMNGVINPRKRRKKFTPNGLAERLSLLTRREAAARTLWKHSHIRPTGYLDLENTDEVESTKNSTLVIEIIDISGEEFHLIQLLCRKCGRSRDRESETSLENCPVRQQDRSDFFTILFGATEFRKSKLGVGAVIQLTQPWMTLGSGNASERTILCPYFFHVLRKSS